MSLISRLRGKQSPGVAVAHRGGLDRRSEAKSWIENDQWRTWDAPLNIVAGESHYLPALRDLTGHVRDEGWLVPVEVELVREPHNPYDHNAIAVVVGDAKLGYINADVCGELAKKLDACGRDSGLRHFPAVIRGGRPGKPYLGVMLWLNRPDVGAALPGIDWDALTDEYAARNWPPQSDEGVD